MMAPRHVRKIRDAKIATPAAANQRVKALRAMFSWANEAEETTVNPTVGVKKLKYASKGHHTWTVEEIEQFNERHPIGRGRGSHLTSCVTRLAGERMRPGSAANIFGAGESASAKPRTSIATRSTSIFRYTLRSLRVLRRRRSGI